MKDRTFKTPFNQKCSLQISLESNEEMKMIIGPLIHSIQREQVTIIPQAVIVINNAKIEAVEEVSNSSEIQKLEAKFHPTEIIKLRDGQFILPGLIDAHTHAAQFPNKGLGYDKQLLDWLTTYTFPLESKYADTNFAKRVYPAVVNRMLHGGTTTAVYFGTIHRSSCQVLAQVAHNAGQRALVGKVNMDMNCPPELYEETDSSVTETETFVQDILSLKSELVLPVVTPRFAVTCTQALLQKLGDIAAKYNLHTQTHLCENKEEIKEVQRLFPAARSYTDVYDQAKLLNRKTILAHCVWLEDSELAIIKDRGCTVAHCPNSNISLQSGLCDIRRVLDAGVNVALGTDVAGGCSSSMLDAIRLCLMTSSVLSLSCDKYKALSYHEAFYLATVGGSIALDMEDRLGNFAPGKYFDAIIIDMKCQDSATEVLTNLSLAELFQKFIYSGDDRNIQKVYVNGKLVVDKA